MKTDFLINILYFLQETVNTDNGKGVTDTLNTLNSVPLPKTFPEFLGMGLILLLSSAVPVTAINAWSNKNTIKDAKTKELEKQIETEKDENNKKDIQIEILKVRLENAERRIQELFEENKQLKQQTNTGFTRQEEMYREHIKKLEQEIEKLRNK